MRDDCDVLIEPGEEYFGSPELFGDQQDQQEYVNQGKYSIGLPCCPTHF